MFGPRGASGAAGSTPRFSGTKAHKIRLPSGIQSNPNRTPERRSVNITGLSGAEIDAHQSSVPFAVSSVYAKDFESCDQLMPDNFTGAAIGTETSGESGLRSRNDRPR